MNNPVFPMRATTPPYSRSTIFPSQQHLPNSKRAPPHFALFSRTISFPLDHLRMCPSKSYFQHPLCPRPRLLIFVTMQTPDAQGCQNHSMGMLTDVSEQTAFSVITPTIQATGSTPVYTVYDIWYDILLTAIGLSPGGSSTVHIYTQPIHRTTQNKKYIEQQHNNLWECGPCPVLASYTLAFALQLRKMHGKTSVRIAASKHT